MTQLRHVSLMCETALSTCTYAAMESDGVAVVAGVDSGVESLVTTSTYNHGWVVRRHVKGTSGRSWCRRSVWRSRRA